MAAMAVEAIPINGTVMFEMMLGIASLNISRFIFITDVKVQSFRCIFQKQAIRVWKIENFAVPLRLDLPILKKDGKEI